MEGLPEGWMIREVGGGEGGGVEAAVAGVWEVPEDKWRREMLPEGWMPKEQEGWGRGDKSLPEGWIPRCPVDPSTASTTGGLASVTFVGGCQRQGLCCQVTSM